MQQAFQSHHFTTPDGKPDGGESYATGVHVQWQQGPLGAPGSPDRLEPNGAFVETVLAIAADRVKFYNDNGFGCRENSLAITKIEEAIHWLEARTARRVRANVEGTHELMKEDGRG